MKKVKPNQLSEAVIEALSSYSSEINEEIKKQAKECSDELTKEIRSNAKRFKGSGRYAKGWTNKKTFESKSDISYVTYNRTDYQLTHLLEYGHEKWIRGKDTGSRVQAFPHIGPAHDKWTDNFVRRCENVISHMG